MTTHDNTLLDAHTCNAIEKRQIRMLIKALGTLCTVDAEFPAETESSARQTIQSIKDYLLDMDDRLSVFKPESEISRLNHLGFKEAVRVSPDTFALLQEAKHYGAETHGIFDVTLGHRTDLWRQSRSTGTSMSPPHDKTGAAVLILDEDHCTARLSMPSLSIDLGGIAKGYAADKVREMLLTGGIDNATLNFGGTVSVIGREREVGLRNPFLPMNRTGKDSPFGRILCKDEVIVTSGIYEQSLGQKALSHHIIDPATGMPSETDLLSATVVSHYGTAADVFATTLIVLGLKKGLTLAQTKKLSVILVDREGKVYLTGSLRNRFAFEKEFSA